MSFHKFCPLFYGLLILSVPTSLLLNILQFQPVLTILSNRDLTNEISRDIEKIDVLEVLGLSPLDQRKQSCTKIPLLANLQNCE